MSSHIIVYLDQNYLSNTAKARIGSLKTEDDANFWHSLFDDLKKAVLADKIACPESEFQSAEASFDTRLVEAVRNVVDELSWGLAYHQFEVILQLQIENAAFEFLGKPPPPREPWLLAFNSDPQAPVKSRRQDIGGTKTQTFVHLSMPDEVVEHDRQLRDKWVAGEERFLKHNICPNWDRELLAQKLSFIDSFLGIQALISVCSLRHSGSDLDKFAASENLKRLRTRWERLRAIGIITGDNLNFLKSDALLNIPFIDIFCSVATALIKYYPRRKPQRGDFHDWAILATVLPYCDIVTTDSFMKEIIVNILHFDDKYKAKIFSATKADRLAFQKFI